MNLIDLESKSHRYICKYPNTLSDQIATLTEIVFCSKRKRPGSVFGRTRRSTTYLIATCLGVFLQHERVHLPNGFGKTVSGWCPMIYASHYLIWRMHGQTLQAIRTNVCRRQAMRMSGVTTTKHILPSTNSNWSMPSRHHVGLFVHLHV